MFGDVSSQQIVPRHPIERTFTYRFLVPFIYRSTEFRQRWQYNNLFYITSSYLPTLLLPNKPTLSEFLQARIINPLSMNSTMISVAKARKSGKLCTGFTRTGVSRDDMWGKRRALKYFIQEGKEEVNLVSKKKILLHLSMSSSFLIFRL